MAIETTIRARLMAMPENERINARRDLVRVLGQDVYDRLITAEEPALPSKNRREFTRAEKADFFQRARALGLSPVDEWERLPA